MLISDITNLSELEVGQIRAPGESHPPESYQEYYVAVKVVGVNHKEEWPTTWAKRKGTESDRYDPWKIFSKDTQVPLKGAGVFVAEHTAEHLRRPPLKGNLFSGEHGWRDWRGKTGANGVFLVKISKPHCDKCPGGDLWRQYMGTPDDDADIQLRDGNLVILVKKSNVWGGYRGEWDKVVIPPTLSERQGAERRGQEWAPGWIPYTGKDGKLKWKRTVMGRETAMLGYKDKETALKFPLVVYLSAPFGTEWVSPGNLVTKPMEKSTPGWLRKRWEARRNFLIRARSDLLFSGPTPVPKPWFEEWELPSIEKLASFIPSFSEVYESSRSPIFWALGKEMRPDFYYRHSRGFPGDPDYRPPQSLRRRYSKKPGGGHGWIPEFGPPYDARSYGQFWNIGMTWKIWDEWLRIHRGLYREALASARRMSPPRLPYSIGQIEKKRVLREINNANPDSIDVDLPPPPPQEIYGLGAPPASLDKGSFAWLIFNDWTRPRSTKTFPAMVWIGMAAFATLLWFMIKK